MRGSLHSKLIAALVASALLASGAAQGLLFSRCGSTLRMSCCCPKEAPPAPSSTLTQSARQSCGKKIDAPSAPAQNVERVVPIVSAPILVAALGTFTGVGPVVVVEHLQQVPRLDPPPGLSPVLANCALLI